jgi:hypothetical protein
MPKYRIIVKYCAEGDPMVEGNEILREDFEAVDLVDAKSKGQEIAENVDTIPFKAYEHDVFEIK